ncbi:hypothetical protein BDR06DRAFT_1015663 [Suillus hirtellus]|nr:hypothetical protein BDR06DRAFT_1015663 [Suillus hirtellus]
MDNLQAGIYRPHDSTVVYVCDCDTFQTQSSSSLYYPTAATHTSESGSIRTSRSACITIKQALDIYIWDTFDYAPEERYKKKYVLPGGIIPGPKKPNNLD